ncbi:short-chain dehydrogenase [Pararhizobium polonicum]|uniref:Short-chain dehydrogenase n=1 Tax=Pararhizobium polonicum TaxID=1612624 RepID=A0A1C7NW17_9HYPH|nr:SDR family NAD(P)-dependent oxidoreductase [Pararhizobium polonicum]OBZ93227.1 short-chain dehydrogenase [Pararhizobium polonicum]
MSRTIENTVALVTGANRGIGREFAAELLRRGARKVYLGARDPASLAALVALDPARLVPLKLDVTNAADVAEAARVATDVTLLINNAGFAGGQGGISAPDLSIARQEMEVNYFGVLALSKAFAPILAKAPASSIVNVLSFLSLVTLPAAGTYSASKAAALAATRTIRAELKDQGTHVVASMPVQVETDMGRGLPEPRLQPIDVVSETLDAVETGVEEVFPGELTRNVAAAFAADPKGLQAHMSATLPA